MNAPAEVLKPGMRWVTAIALFDVSFNNAPGDVKVKGLNER